MSTIDECARTPRRAPGPHAPPRFLSPQPAFLLVAIVVAAASWRVSHPPNFTPIGAIALFGGASFADRRAAFLVPLGAMIASDLVLGVHVLIPVVYACFAFNVVLGWWLRRRRRPLTVAAVTLVGSCVFFLVTNAACWALWYPRTVAGLVACSVAAIPFFRYTFLGDGFYSAVLFTALVLGERLIRALREQSLGKPSPATI